MNHCTIHSIIKQIIFCTIIFSVFGIAHGQERYFPHHTTADGLLKIDVEYVNKYLPCTIDDNSIGLKSSQKTKATFTKKPISHGLDIVKKRIKLINQLSDESHGIDVIDKKYINSNPPLRGARVLMKLYTR